MQLHPLSKRRIKGVDILDLIRCCKCEHSQYFERSEGYVCKHSECKEVRIFTGKTKPHYCPLTGGKKYIIHGNTTKLSSDIISANSR